MGLKWTNQNIDLGSYCNESHKMTKRTYKYVDHIRFWRGLKVVYTSI